MQDHTGGREEVLVGKSTNTCTLIWRAAQNLGSRVEASHEWGKVLGAPQRRQERLLNWPETGLAGGSMTQLHPDPLHLQEKPYSAIT